MPSRVLCTLSPSVQRMRFIRPIGGVLHRLLWVAWGTERALAGLGTVALPLAVLLAIVSGELLVHARLLGGVSGYGGVRSLHILATEVVALVVAYRLAAVLIRGWRWLHTGALRSRRRERRVTLASVAAVWLPLAGYWACLNLLLISGVARWTTDVWGWSAPPPFSSGAWIVLHAVLRPFFYGCLVVIVYVRLRRAISAVRGYVLRHY